MVNKTKRTFKEWLEFSEEKKKALLLESKEKQNEIKNRPTGMIWDRLRAYLYNRVNHKQGFTQLELLKIKSSDKFPKALASDFAKSYEKWQAENLG